MTDHGNTYSGECGVHGCDQYFAGVEFEDVIDHIFDEHADAIGDYGDLEDVIFFDFAPSTDQVKHIHRRLSEVSDSD